MTLYKKLTLTGLSLINNSVDRLMEEKMEFNATAEKLSSHVYVSDDIQNTLSSELLTQLKSIGLTPVIVVNFSEYGESYETPIHSDITLYNDNWVPMPFGINWELAEGTTIFNWYDSKGYYCVYPGYQDEMTSWPRRMLNGTRYHQSKVGKLEKINSVRLIPNTAYLVKTEIPHQIVSNTPGGIRIAISIRFPLDQVGSWEQALEVFKPFYAD